MICGECPLDVFQGQAVLNVAVLFDVGQVVEADKIGVSHLPECCGGGKEEADNKQILLCWHRIILVVRWKSIMFHRRVSHTGLKAIVRFSR